MRAALVAAAVAGATVSVTIYVSQVRTARAVAAVEHARDFRDFHDFHAILRQVRASDSALNPSVLRQEALSAALVRLGRGAEAERKLAAAARRRPSTAELWVTLAFIRVGQGHRAAARAAYARARALDPQIPPPVFPPVPPQPRSGPRATGAGRGP